MVDTVVKGRHLAGSDERFERFSFSVEGLQDWSRISGVSTTYTQEAGNPAINNLFERVTPKPVEIEEGDLNFRFFSTFQLPSEKWSISLREDTQIHVTAAAPKTIGEWIYEVVLPFRRLIQFAVKSGGTLQRLAVSHKRQDTGGGASDPDWFNLIQSGAGNYELDMRTLQMDPPFLQLDDFAATPESLQKWFALHRKYREPIVAVLDSQLGSPTSDYVFFVHARLLERLVSHYPQAELCDKPTMRKIISLAKSLVDESKREQLGQKIGSARRNDAKAPLLEALRTWIPYLDSGQPSEEFDWIATKIVKTRNHFAHQGSDKNDPNRIQPGEFRVFTDLTRTIIDFEIANALGFGSELVKSRLQDHREWRNAKVVHEVWKDTVYCEGANQQDQ